MRIISIDPGLDLVALAVFEYDGSRRWAVADSVAKVNALVEIITFHTKPKDSLGVRLGDIYARTVREIDRVGTRAVFVEMPAMAGGAYASTRGRNGASRNAASMGHFHMALGVILAACDPARTGNELRLYPASTKMKKTARLDYVRGLLQKHAPGFAKAGQDKLDAVYVGLAQSWPTL
jgi:hypothetical protein